MVNMTPNWNTEYRMATYQIQACGTWDVVRNTESAVRVSGQGCVSPKIGHRRDADEEVIIAGQGGIGIG